VTQSSSSSSSLPPPPPPPPSQNSVAIFVGCLMIVVINESYKPYATPCSHVLEYQCFGEPCCLHLQGHVMLRRLILCLSTGMHAWIIGRILDIVAAKAF
jgi:hypothetical protein